MPSEIVVRVHAIARTGLPDMEALAGRVALIHDGCVVSGWPLRREEHADAYAMVDADLRRQGQRAIPPRAGGLTPDAVLWEGDSEVGHNRVFVGVTHWIEFPVPVRELKSLLPGARAVTPPAPSSDLGWFLAVIFGAGVMVLIARYVLDVF